MTKSTQLLGCPIEGSAGSVQYWALPLEVVHAYGRHLVNNSVLIFQLIMEREKTKFGLMRNEMEEAMGIQARLREQAFLETYDVAPTNQTYRLAIYHVEVAVLAFVKEQFDSEKIDHLFEIDQADLDAHLTREFKSSKWVQIGEPA